MLSSRAIRRLSRPLNNLPVRQAGKVVKFGVEGRALILQGVDLLADAVQVRYLFRI